MAVNNGVPTLPMVAAPGDPAAGYGGIFFDSADNHVKVVTNGPVITDLMPDGTLVGSAGVSTDNGVVVWNGVGGDVVKDPTASVDFGGHGITNVGNVDGVDVSAHKDRHDPNDGADPLDCAAAGEIVGVAAAAEGSAHSFARSDHTHQIQHSLANNHVITIDGTPANDEYAKWTASGLEGRAYSDVLADLSGQAGAAFDWNGQDVSGMLTLTLPNVGLHLLDTNASHDLIIAPGSDLTADHTFTLITGDADRSLTLSGNPTLGDWFDQSMKQAASPTFADLALVGIAPVLDVKGTNYGGLYLRAYENGANPAYIIFDKARGASFSIPVIVQDDDCLGQIAFRGFDGSGFEQAAKIEAFVDGVPSDGTDMPGRLVFSTTPDGTDVPVKRVIIDSDGNTRILLQKELRFYEGANYVGWEAPALAADQVYIWPATSATGALSNAAGTTSWKAYSGLDATIVTGTAGVATNLAVWNADGDIVDGGAGGAGLPTGGIIVWHGTIANIPAGYVICDGNNSTPNLLTRFVQGVATAATDPGATGGAATHTLTVAELASHYHSISFNSGIIYPANLPSRKNRDITPSTINSNSTGSDSAHENEPPYYDVAFLMKT